MKKIVILILAIITTQAGIAQQTQRLTASKHNEYGLVYSLPITNFKISVTAEKTTYTAGIYSKYAKMYLSHNNAIAEGSQTWSIKDIKIESYGTPDTDNKYLMQFRSGTTPFLILSENGLPISLNIEPTPVSGDKKNDNKDSTNTNDNNRAVKAAQSSLSGEFLVSESSAKRAEIAAKQIYKIRESRTNLIIGEAEQMPPDGAAMQLMLNELDAQEAALLALFIGEEKHETVTHTFNYTPTLNINSEVIFRLSDFNGVVDKNDLSGEPVYIELVDTSIAELPVDEMGVAKKLPKGAVMYKIPGEAEVALRYEGNTLLTQKFEIAQFGIDFGLDPAIFTDKKQPAYVIFNPQSGSIKELGAVNK